jgi:hypothetical protein
VRFALTGGLLADIPVDGQHLVFALDLALLAPTLVLAGIPPVPEHRDRVGDGGGGHLVRRLYKVNLRAAAVSRTLRVSPA